MPIVSESTHYLPVSDLPLAKRSGCGLSWTTIIAGAFVTAITSFMLLLLGAGFGLSTVSPWAGSGISGVAFTALTAIWLIIVQWLSAALGGYLTGRLRRKTPHLPADEVFFRDTAHGLLGWCLATVFSLCLLASIAGGFMRAGHAMAEHRAAVSEGAAAEHPVAAPNPAPYEIDRLLRAASPTSAPRDPAVRDEVARILARSQVDETALATDRAYLAQLVAAQTSIGAPEAEQRVQDTLTRLQQARDKAKEAADDLRKGGMLLALYSFFGMLVGAFVASVAAALGGRHRDAVVEPNP